MVYIIVFLFCVYLALLLAFIHGWNKSLSKDNNIDGIRHFISVVIPFRNEENNIKATLQSLLEQDYSDFEVILIDDDSTDSSLKIVNDFVENDQRFRILRAQKIGKKHALAQAIKEANGTVIVTTDADCSFSVNWLASINRTFNISECKMGIGAVAIDADQNFFSKLQTIEFASLVGATVSSLFYNHPIMCNGANLSFTKDVFFEVNGYEGNTHIASGDDEFLMRKFFQRYPDDIHFVNQPEAVVHTNSSPMLHTFVQQRIRWASKWRFNPSLSTKLLAVFILLLQVNFLVAIVVSTLSPLASILIPLLLAKALLEYIFLVKICRFTGAKWNFLAFVVLQIVYPLYVIFVGVLSNFLTFSWKGRRSSLATE